MVITLQLDPASLATISRHARAASDVPAALGAALEASVVTGAEEVREGLVRGEGGLVMRHQGSGLAASLAGWMIDPAAPLGAVGVPSNSPAAAYAAIQDYGGLITPKKGKALAVPISAEARNYASPRDMMGLTLLPRLGRPPLLVRMLKRPGKGGRTFVPHWVLVPSVRIRATGWFRRGVAAALGPMAEAFGRVLSKAVRAWSKG